MQVQLMLEVDIKAGTPAQLLVALNELMRGTKIRNSDGLQATVVAARAEVA